MKRYSGNVLAVAGGSGGPKARYIHGSMWNPRLKTTQAQWRGVPSMGEANCVYAVALKGSMHGHTRHPSEAFEVHQAHGKVWQSTPLGHHLSPFFFRTSGHKFQQDGCPSHKSMMVRRFLQRKRISQLNNGVWPANSPDLNPVEHIWPMVSRQLQGKVFDTCEHLWHALRAAFKDIPQAAILKLYCSMDSRCKAVIEAKGGPTHY